MAIGNRRVPIEGVDMNDNEQAMLREAKKIFPELDLTRASYREDRNEYSYYFLSSGVTTKVVIPFNPPDRGDDAVTIAVALSDPRRKQLETTAKLLGLL